MADSRANSWALITDQRIYLLCRCGYDRTIETDGESSYPTRCERCGARFINEYEFVWEKDIRYRSPFVWEWRLNHGEYGWSVSAVVPLPLGLRKGKPCFEDFPLARITIERNGTMDEERCHPHLLDAQIVTEKGIQGPNGPKIFRELRRQLLNWIVIRPTPAIQWLMDEEGWQPLPIEQKLDMLCFFLENSSLRETTFYFWQGWEGLPESLPKFETVMESTTWLLAGRREKRVWRAFFESYESAMRNGDYSPLPDAIFSRTIEDPNHLEKLIRLPSEIKRQLFDGLSWEEALELSRWLRSFYGEKGCVRFWKSVNMTHINNRYVRDIHRLIRVMRRNEGMRERFRRPSARIEALHDRLVEASGAKDREWEWAIEFDYPESVLRYEGEYEGWSFRLPKTGRELAEWGRILHNYSKGKPPALPGDCQNLIVTGVFRYPET